MAKTRARSQTVSTARRPRPGSRLPSHRRQQLPSGLRRRRGVHGFTLVELLVVIGIIAVLIALLMPALVGMRKKAQTIVCGANLRSIGQALVMYTQRYDHYPSCYVSYYSNHAIWPVRLRPFTGGDQGVFYCPAQDERCEWKKVSPEPGAPGRATEAHARFGYEEGEPLLDWAAVPRLYFSYGYNAWGVGGNSAISPPSPHHTGLGDLLVVVAYPGVIHRELRANRVRKPAEMIAIADTSADGVGDFGVSPRFALNPAQRAWPGTIHNGGANVLFCDGHVQWYPQKALLVSDKYDPAEDHIRRMWNNHHRIDAGNGNPD